MFDSNIYEIFDSLEDGITIIDVKGRIVFLNKKAQKLDNIDLNEVVGRHVLEVYPSLSQRTSTLLNVLETGNSIKDNTQSFINFKGEKITTVNTTLPIIKNDKVVGAIEISRDLTSVKKITDELINLKNQLTIKKDSKDIERKLYTFMDIIGESNEILSVKNIAIKASNSSSPVFIYGETGVGKELFVQAIHTSSSRRNNPFIAQNCAAVPEQLLEGILFGTVKGSFTGSEDRPGLLELADGGTLYLDELNSMPLSLQAKLLRVIQDGVIRRVGDIKEKKVDVRFIASTNLHPEECLKRGLIRKDLYYRLNVISIEIPELKKRKSDIPLLVKHFIEKYSIKLGKSNLGISDDAMESLINYSWPGNIRELEHTIESIMNLKEDNLITLNDLPEHIKACKDFSLQNCIEQYEKKLIEDTLKICDNNVSLTAKKLNIPRQTLQYKIKKYFGSNIK
ncbi:sigma-54 interaction domain-containing protein [Thermobrachium celere]|uniref:Arginine utilization regulatory protein RocR n=1 Tax=Thermobrachium celere DSM 8682 TaxID=941824 RepID=R7RPT1_9CLOT|nr:sigma-54-dependent Fis family transcriptional regulator [Thermobrachium celere]CDF57245.1 Arginine utilization regulatory protein RocR [Thermobrachium celere DSM 8682]